jgi:hypothetical protein
MRNKEFEKSLKHSKENAIAALDDFTPLLKNIDHGLLVQMVAQQMTTNICLGMLIDRIEELCDTQKKIYEQSQAL